MNIASLIDGAPELADGLKGLGLTDVNIADMAEGIGQQLGGDDGFISLTFSPPCRPTVS